MQNIIKILKKYTEISKEDRKTITEMITIFVKAYFSVIKERESIKIKQGKEMLLAGEKALEENENI